MFIEVRPATQDDVPALGRLYDELNDYMAAHTNYPGWKKGIYPTIEHAAEDVAEGANFIAWSDNSVAGSIVLNHKSDQPQEYQWLIKADENEVFFVHRLAVHPQYQRHGIGRILLSFADEYARQTGMKAIRLDVTEGNSAAINMYEACGYKYIDTVDLGLEHFGLPWFRLYEKPIDTEEVC
jgi:ribosomal protein S18 acetylase RimI-like enzyme